MSLPLVMPRRRTAARPQAVRRRARAWHRPAHVMNEQLFRGAVIRERHRAERFGHPLAVLTVAIDGRPDASAVGAWSAITTAVAAATRETDLVGWVNRHEMLGVILADVTSTDCAIAAQLEARIKEELASRLDPGTIVRLSVRTHFPASCRKVGVPVAEIVDGLDLHKGRTPRPVRDALKRALDVIGSLALLAFLSPVFLLVAALVRLTSPGPIFFRQVRVGLMAQPFHMLKFRTMYANADHALHQEFVTRFIKSGGQPSQGEGNALFKIANDPRVTPLGRVLRKTSLDELPQLWNVVRGDMSLVGPRPPLPYELEQYQAWHWRRVIDATPGITGLWQVVGRSRTSFDDMVRLDLRYVKARSFWTDIRILLATPRAVVSGKGAC